MSNALALLLHVIFAAIWLGGMLFAHQALRPAALKLDPPLRLTLWVDTFGKFFPWVWAAITLLPLTGYWMVFKLLGGFGTAGMHVHLMQLTGWAMIAVFLHVYFAPYQRLKKTVAAKNFPEAANHLASIRKLVGINVILGLTTIAIAAGGRLL